MNKTKYPEIKVKLTGKNGNAFVLMGAVSQALRKAGVSGEKNKAFMDEAMSGDYNHLLNTCMRWVTVL